MRMKIIVNAICDVTIVVVRNYITIDAGIVEKGLLAAPRMKAAFNKQ